MFTTISKNRSLAVLLLVGWTTSAPAAEKPKGPELYKTICARCHGAQGQGTKRHKQRLEGDRSVAQLAEVIRKTMPEDDPGSLSATEAGTLASYIHEAFYSRVARERNRPARIELARLTVRQHRNALADLIGSFRWQPNVGTERGLKGEYFRNRRFRIQDRVLRRVDPLVNFDFGTDTPVPGKIDPHEFSIRWNGSLLPPETGEYQFVIHTEHAARLWVNDTKTPLIDAWVKSGNDTEYRATLFLVAGRIYPLRLEYSKAKQGVDDSKKNKVKKPPAKSSIKLLWQRPHQAVEPVPVQQLSTAPAPEVFVCTTPFPPDDQSYGWARGTTVSKEWDQAATDAAIEAAGHVARHLDELAGTSSGAGDRREKIRSFCRTFAERAFRRPLTADQRAILDRQVETAKTPEAGIKRVVLLVLKSPRFLYRELGGGADDYDVASRLSFGLWDSIPDRTLLEAAAAGRLSAKEEVRKQAERMLTDLRTGAKLRDFLLTWLKANHGHDLAKDARAFPGFDASVITDLKTSLELFLDDVVWSESSDFRQLFLAEEVFLNDRLARFYGTEVPKDTGFLKVKMDAGRRAGVLTHPYLMARFADNRQSSPIHRGVFLARGLLGVGLRPPPQAVAPLAPDLHPGLTTRERVILQTKPGTCMSCHGIINPLGFSLEHFDAAGRFREQDNSKPVDARGSYQTRDGKTIRIDGARDLGTFLASNPEAHAAFAEQLFHHLVQQPLRAYGDNTLVELTRSFTANRFHIRKLAVEIMVKTAFQPRQVTGTTAKGR
jgi:Protein of unknown function (DUF1592)/Protein of unknown function (DUF1588)/PA14 domain/Protein of unknown function (DUF1595)/Cytochrome C oxidase, cbb3-type, subunit III